MSYQNSTSRKIDPEKVTAERLNGYAAFLDCFALYWCICNNGSNYSRICLMRNNFWKTAEIMNGRLAMMGLLAAVINYGFTGWIIPGFV